MSLFTKDEAFDFIANFLQVKNAEQRMITDRRVVLDEILISIQVHIPFQNVLLMSKPPLERRKPSDVEFKANFVGGLGGLCFELNISTFHLLTAIGFDVSLVHSTVSSTVSFPNNHIVLFINNLEKDGDVFLADVASGPPTFQAVSLDFERESPAFINSYLEFKFVKHEGKILRMHRKGDRIAMKGRQENSGVDFWLDDWRRFYTVEMEGTKDLSEFDEIHSLIYTNPKSSPFHVSNRIVIYKGGKAAMVVNDKTLMENDEGELVSTELSGGDKGIVTAIKQLCPQMPDDVIHNSVIQWRLTIAANE